MTVRKEFRGQKSGISLVERQGGVYVTNVANDGLFGNSEVEAGDQILSMNGKRLKKGDTPQSLMKQIASNEPTVTMVVKKDGITPSRGSRGGKIKKKPLRLYKKDNIRNKDGSLNPDIDPRNLKFLQDDDDKDQIQIKGHRIFEGQNIGVSFVDHNNKVFVTKIGLDSIFRETDLAIGDRVVAVNEMSFMTFADSNLAAKQAKKGGLEPILVVEKGHINIPEEARKNLESTELFLNLDVDNEEEEEMDLSMGASKSFTSSYSSICGQSRDEKPRPLKAPRNSPTKPDDDSTSSSSSDCESSSSDGGRVHQERISPRGLMPRSSGSLKGALRAPVSQGTTTKSGSTLFASPSRLRQAGNRVFRPAHSSKTPSTPSNRSAKQTVRARHASDSEESSLEGDIAAAAAALSPERKSALQNSHSFQSSLSKMRMDDYGGDYIRIRVAKNSEAKPGIQLKKTEGKFILVGLPDHEKRIPLGVQVLAINDAMNLHTVVKAEELMSKTSGYVTLMIEFTSPIQSRRLCPCCGESIFANGDHVSARKGRGKVKADDEMSIFSEDSSIFTIQAGNRSQPAAAGRSHQTVSRISEHSRGKYNVDEYDSDESKVRAPSRSPPSPRTATKRFTAGDKFMVRVTKTDRNRDPGISLVDHKGSLYVANIVPGGLFYNTPIDTGDVLVSVNGRKNIKQASAAMEIILGPREAINLYVLRPGKANPEVKEAMERCR